MQQAILLISITMKKLVLLLLILPLLASAQQNKRVDSLQNLLTHTKADTQKVNILNQLACTKWDTEFTRCIKNATDAIALAGRIKFLRGQADGYLNRGDVYYGKLKPDSAIADYKAGIEVSKKAGYSKGMAIGYDDLGVIMRTQGHTAEAIAYFQKAAEIYTTINDLDGSSNSYTNLANNYNQLNQFDKALTGYTKAYQLRVKIKARLKAAQSLAGIGMTYRNKQLFTTGPDKTNFKLSVQYMNKALKEFIELKHEVNQGLAYKELGITYLQDEDYVNTLKNLLPAEEIFTRIGFKRELGSLNKGIGRAYLYLKRYDLAKL
ncbi:MAG: tetratricopeptide repeat protein, partial [Sphingobacteriaceae bacterium]